MSKISCCLLLFCLCWEIFNQVQKLSYRVVVAIQFIGLTIPNNIDNTKLSEKVMHVTTAIWQYWQFKVQCLVKGRCPFELHHKVSGWKYKYWWVSLACLASSLMKTVFTSIVFIACAIDTLLEQPINYSFGPRWFCNF